MEFCWTHINDRSSLPEVFYKKGALRHFAKFTGKHLCLSLFFNVFFKVFSCEFCKILKNTFSYGTPAVAASDTFLSIFIVKKISPFYVNWNLFSVIIDSHSSFSRKWVKFIFTASNCSSFPWTFYFFLPWKASVYFVFLIFLGCHLSI